MIVEILHFYCMFKQKSRGPPQENYENWVFNFGLKLCIKMGLNKKTYVILILFSRSMESKNEITQIELILNRIDF